MDVLHNQFSLLNTIFDTFHNILVEKLRITSSQNHSHTAIIEGLWRAVLNYITHLKIEWPTVGLIALCYGTWTMLMLNASAIPVYIWVPVTGILLTLFWSLVHEAIHGHPTTSPWLNHALLFLPLGWVYSYERFRETHLEHHRSGDLTDPFDDPESFYLAQNSWLRQNRLMQVLLVFNNTLAGRLLIGPLVSVPRFYFSEVKLMLAGGPTGFMVLKSWLLHLTGIGILAWFLVNVHRHTLLAACAGGLYRRFPAADPNLPGASGLRGTWRADCYHRKSWAPCLAVLVQQPACRTSHKAGHCLVSSTRILSQTPRCLHPWEQWICIQFLF